MDKHILIDNAYSAMEKSYSPYSHFKVGAALVTEDGSIYTGCNIENASYGAAICAERTAMVKAVSEGHKSFKYIAIVSSSHEKTLPCGICRQVLSEFSTDMYVIAARSEDDYDMRKLSDFLPASFGAGQMI